MSSWPKIDPQFRNCVGRHRDTRGRLSLGPGRPYTYQQMFHCCRDSNSTTSIRLTLLVSPEQLGRHFADNIISCIFVNEKFCILIKISLKFVPKGPISHNPVLVQVMAWCRTGDKPLPEAMLIQFTDAYMRY